jgi:hypothetical protein
MKINLKSSENKQQISSIRSQIDDAGDLKKFDEFLAKNDSFDFGDENDVAAARKCCSGDECCTIVISTSFRAN